ARVVPIVIDAAAHEFVIPAAEQPRMVQIDPDCWLIKELDFEKTQNEYLFQLEHARCVLGRLAAARALAKSTMERPETIRALAAAWKREKAVAARRAIVGLLGSGQETCRAVLCEAAGSAEARVRVAAIEGLIKLKHDDATERLFRSVWSNPREA